MGGSRCSGIEILLVDLHGISHARCLIFVELGPVIHGSGNGPALLSTYGVEPANSALGLLFRPIAGLDSGFLGRLIKDAHPTRSKVSFLFIYYLTLSLPLNRIVPHISAYRKTTFTVRDWLCERTPTAKFHAWWLDKELQAYCRTDETRSGHLYLSSFLVTPAFRGLGVSATFLDSVLRGAYNQGYERILLKVHEDNYAAQRLYINAGFKVKNKFNKRYEMERLV